ncbi:C40 family peptidase [Apilactobacillus ozensis]|uniref:C40 family peptidase n=1 Tax=Apilactobacillus ozensis TaxID=866801 RepID=UPI000705203B|nr:C40 family peptidase [Apilactobacillus ozensis]
MKRKILTICLTALICVFFVKISAANADEINPGTDSTSTNLTDASNNVLPENNANNNNADNNSENNANDKSDKKENSQDDKKKKIDKKYKKLYKQAKKELGKKYRYGATGSKSFDCSGFTKYVYKKALNKKLPRTAAQQYRSAKKVTKSERKSGDLVFFGSSKHNITHVGLYIGDGKMIDAQNRGVVVENVNAPWWKAVGYSRPYKFN